jgi:ATP-dependent Clp protease ATP-binding subunit ClpB
LRGLKERYDIHHGVRIQDSALVTAAVLSNRYITDRFLPDKAIDLVDEACATIRTEMDSMPTELDEVTRRVMQLEIEEAALKKEKDKASQERLESIRKELADQRAKADALRAQWESEKNAIQKVQSLREEIDRVRHEISVAERNYDLNRAAELKHGRLPELERKLKEEEEALVDKEGTGRLLREEITDDEIAEIVSRWTGIPVSRLMEGEREKLLKLEEQLHDRVVGQDEAVQSVAEAVLRSRAGIKDPNRPIGTFIFLGPTGVGKTELARALAEKLFDDENNMVRIDMSEYMEKHTVARLIGAPPGYVGYEEGGQLTEAVRRKPYSVILFDEIEKAHQEVFSIFLHIMDDGRLTDSHGRTVDFKNCIIIMTSNIGSQYILDTTGTDEASYERMRERVLQAMRQHFRPEFLNRVDEILVFHSLTKEQLAQIVDIQVAWLKKRLADRRITLEFTDEAKRLVAERGYDPVYGARPLKRVIQRAVETPLAKKIMAGEIPDSSRVLVSTNPQGLVFKVTEENSKLLEAAQAR